MCTRRSPRQGEKENKQWAPWCYFYSHFCDSSHAFIWHSVNNSEQMFFWLWEEDALFSTNKHNAKANKEQKTGWLITTCVLPITLITLEVTRPINGQHSAKTKIHIHSATVFSERNIETSNVPLNKHHSLGKWVQPYKSQVSSKRYCHHIFNSNFTYWYLQN